MSMPNDNADSEIDRLKDIQVRFTDRRAARIFLDKSRELEKVRRKVSANHVIQEIVLEHPRISKLESELQEERELRRKAEEEAKKTQSKLNEALEQRLKDSEEISKLKLRSTELEQKLKAFES